MLKASFDNLLNGSILEKNFFIKYFISQILNKNVFSLNNLLIILLSLIIIYIAILLNKYSNRKIFSNLKNKNISTWLYSIFTQIYIILLSLFFLSLLFTINKNYNFSGLLFIISVSFCIILVNTFIAILKNIFPKYVNNNKKIIFIIVLIFIILCGSGYFDFIIKILKSYNIHFGKTKLSFYDVLSKFFTIVFVLFIFLWIANMVSSVIGKIPNIDNSLKVIFSNIIKIFILIISIISIMPIIGIDITALAIFTGVFAASLGFCLKNILSNYLSGFIILLDRSVKINDKISVDNFTGYVSKITPRFVVLKNTLDQEILVPNDIIISKIIINQNYSNKLFKKFINVYVDYDSDINKAIEILNNSVNTQPVNLYKTKSRIKEFNQNGVSIELSFWVLEIDLSKINYTDIYLYIWQEFTSNNIQFFSKNYFIRK